MTRKSCAVGMRNAIPRNYLKQLERRSLKKKSGIQRDSNQWPPRYRCIALPTELWSHTLGARSISWVHISDEIYNIWILPYNFTSFTPHRRYELNQLTSLPKCGFIAQLVEQRTGIAEVTGSNPVEAVMFFRLLSNCLSWKIYCDGLSSFSSITAVQYMNSFT